VENYRSNATLFGYPVSDEAIVEYLQSIPESVLRYSIPMSVNENSTVYIMNELYQQAFYDFSLELDALPFHMKIQLFNYEPCFHLYFKNKDLTLLNYILSTGRIEYPVRIAMLETYDIETTKCLISWIVTNNTSDIALETFAEKFNFFQNVSKEDRQELKRHFWNSSYVRNPREYFHHFPSRTEQSVWYGNIQSLYSKYNILFGKNRIESKGWTDEDVDVMVTFVKKNGISPYSIALDLRGKTFYGQIRVFKASLETGDNYVKFCKCNSAYYTPWDIPSEIFNDRRFSDFINKMKLKHGV